MTSRMFYCTFAAGSAAWWIYAHIWFMLPFSILIFALWYGEDDD